MLCEAVVAPWFSTTQRLDRELPHSKVPSLVWASFKHPARAGEEMAIGQAEGLPRLYLCRIQPFLCCIKVDKACLRVKKG